MILEMDGTPFFWEGVRLEMTRVSDEVITGGIPMHSHAADSLELHVILAGGGQVRTRDRTHAVKAGDVFVTVGGAEHEQSSCPQDPMRELCVYAAFRRAGKAGESVRTLLSNDFFLWHADEDMLLVARRMERELGRRFTGYADAIRSCFCLMLIGAARAERQRGGSAETDRRGGAGDMYLKIEEAFLYRYRTVTLSGLAREVGLSARQLQRVLKAHYGASFSEKKTEARMRAADLLLETTDLSVARIAEETGYAGAEHFCAEYKKHGGMTAGAYRRQCRSAPREEDGR